MTLQPDHSRRLFNLAAELAYELRCQLHAGSAADPRLQASAEAVLARYQRLVAVIDAGTRNSIEAPTNQN